MHSRTRGSIWKAWVGRGAEGREQDAPKIKERPCLVISADPYNEERDRITVVSITDRSGTDPSGRHRLKPLVDRDVPITLAEIAIEKGDSGLYKNSVVRCSQIKTVFKHSDSPKLLAALQAAGVRSMPSYRSDLCDGPRCGQTKDLAIAKVEQTLALLLGGESDSSGRDLRFKRGDVFMARLPSGPVRPCLVISPNRDMERNNFSLATVVPLQGAGKDIEESSTLVRIELIGSSDNYPINWLAECQEIYSLDWNARGAAKIGEVPDISSVLNGIRRYLDLPLLEKPMGTERKSPHAAFDEERRKEARDRREATNRLGVEFRETQQEAEERWLEWEDNEGALKGPAETGNPSWIHIAAEKGARRFRELVAITAASLAAWPSPRVEAIPVMGSQREEEDDLKEIVLPAAFNLSEADFRQQVPWLEPKVVIGRTVDRATGSVHHVANGKRCREGGGASQPEIAALHLVLVGSDGTSAEARITPILTAVLFKGEALPADWREVRLELALELTEAVKHET